MTRGAGQGALTRPEPVNVDVIVDGDVKEVVPLLGLKRIKLVSRHFSSLFLIISPGRYVSLHFPDHKSQYKRVC